MFLNGLDLQMNFLNPGGLQTTLTCTQQTHTHSPLISIHRGKRHVVLIQPCVMKLVRATARPYYMYYVTVCQGEKKG